MNQLALFDLNQFTQYSAPICDPVWDEQEPPDPDDYPFLNEYETAWSEWVEKYPELIPETQVMSVREQVSPNTLDTVREQKSAIKFAPEHTHWIEEYWVKRCGKKYKYWRYCWMEGRKIKRCHLGGVRSPLSLRKKEMVEIAIADGKTPPEIKQIIKPAIQEILVAASEISAVHPRRGY